MIVGATPSAGQSSKGLIPTVLQYNKDHEQALRTYIEQLESELHTVDKLRIAAHAGDDDDEPELDVGGCVVVPESVKPVGLIPSAELLAEDSPFFDDAERRTRYLNFVSMHPMKTKELEALAEAVRGENYRIHAFRAQKRGQELFSALDKQTQTEIEQNKEGLDWERIAEKVSTTSTVPRTAKECEIRWLGDRHPQLNHETWSQAELANLRTLVAEYGEGQVDWVQVAKKLGTNRIPLDCMRHAVYRKNHIWTPESDERLLAAINAYGTDNWNQVARSVSDHATAQQCQSRFMRTLDPSLTRGAWSPAEDAQLQAAVEAYGPHAWVDVAALVPGRNNEQCRDRWQDKLNPTLVKGKWTEEEDRALVSAVERLGTAWKECRIRHEALMKRHSNTTPASEPSRGGSSLTPFSHQAVHESVFRLDFGESPNLDGSAPAPRMDDPPTQGAVASLPGPATQPSVDPPPSSTDSPPQQPQPMRARPRPARGKAKSVEGVASANSIPSPSAPSEEHEATSSREDGRVEQAKSTVVWRAVTTPATRGAVDKATETPPQSKRKRTSSRIKPAPSLSVAQPNAARSPVVADSGDGLGVVPAPSSSLTTPEVAQVPSNTAKRPTRMQPSRAASKKTKT